MDTLAEASEWAITRREFLRASGVVIAGLSWGARQVHADDTERRTILRFGIVTDVHYADTETRQNRHYRESAAKMVECVACMNDQKVDFLVELGDFKDEGRPAMEHNILNDLEAIEKIFGQFKGRRYHVLGNHDVDSISKDQFLARVTNTGIAPNSKYYSFDSKGMHFVVLDANYKIDGSDYDRGNFVWTDTNIPSQELAWLESDLASTSNPVIVFVHQPLDDQGQFGINNAVQVRQILQDSQRVFAVFQGHNHAGHYSRIEGVHYYTLRAMVDGAGTRSSSYAVVDVHDDLSILVKGYRRAEGRKLGMLRKIRPDEIDRP